MTTSITCGGSVCSGERHKDQRFTKSSEKKDLKDVDVVLWDSWWQYNNPTSVLVWHQTRGGRQAGTVSDKKNNTWNGFSRCRCSSRSIATYGVWRYNLMQIINDHKPVCKPFKSEVYPPQRHTACSVHKHAVPNFYLLKCDCYNLWCHLLKQSKAPHTTMRMLSCIDQHSNTT